MLDLTPIKSMGAGLGTTFIWGMVIFIVCMIVTGIVIKLRRKLIFNWVVRIWEHDGTGKLIELPEEKGGIVLDKRTSYRLFLIDRYKYGLKPDNIPYIQNSKGKKVVFLLRKGLKNFQYLNPTICDNPGITFDVQDEDVACAINAFTLYKNPVGQDRLQMILPYVGLLVIIFALFGAAYFFFVKAGFNADLLRELSNAAKDISKNMAAAGTGTIVQ